MTCSRTRPIAISALLVGFVSVAIALTGTAAAALEREEFSRTFERTVTLSSGQRLSVDNSNGDVTVRARPGSQAQVTVTIRASAPSGTEAARFGNAITIDVSTQPGEILFRTVTPKISGFFGGRKNVELSYSIDYEITMPPAAPLNVTNRFGNVMVAGIEAGATIDNGHGLLTLQNARGNHRLKNSFGGVEVTRNQGDVTIANSNGFVSANFIEGSVLIDDRFGNVTVESIRDNVSISSGNGTVRATSTGSADITTSFGPVELRTIRGTARVENSNGDITAIDVAGNAELNTSFGAIRFDNVRGDVTSTASNSSVAGQRAAKSVTVSTTFGMVGLKDVGGHVSVRNSNGGVNAARIAGNADITTTFSPVELEDVAGTVEVTNSNGSIDLRSTRVRTGAACRDVILNTTFGSISVLLSETSDYAVSGRTTFGGITTDLPLDVTEDSFGTNRSVSGRLGSGACRMILTNSNGSIEVQRLRGK